MVEMKCKDETGSHVWQKERAAGASRTSPRRTGIRRQGLDQSDMPSFHGMPIITKYDAEVGRRPLSATEGSFKMASRLSPERKRGICACFSLSSD